MSIDDDDVDLQKTLGNLNDQMMKGGEQFSLINQVNNPFKQKNDQENQILNDGFDNIDFPDDVFNHIGVGNADDSGYRRVEQDDMDLDGFDNFGDLESGEQDADFMKRQQEEYEKLQKMYMTSKSNSKPNDMNAQD